MVLTDYLTQRSAEICAANGCTDVEHRCESYAYINAQGQLLDICIPDYFPGSTEPFAAIPLPWQGTRTELRREIAEQCDESGL